MKPIDMIIHCPACKLQHIDRPSEGWSNPPHKSHLCGGCGLVWRVADVPTNGVKSLKTRGSGDTEVIKQMTPLEALAQIFYVPAKDIKSWRVETAADKTAQFTIKFVTKVGPGSYHLKGVELINFLGDYEALFKVSNIPELRTFYRALGET